MEEQKRLDIEKALQEGRTLQIKPQGYSMYPMFVPGRDEAVIAPVKPAELKRGDVALYRREEGILVLHRLVRHTKEGFYFVGEQQTEVEGPLRADQIKGVLIEFIRNGRRISIQNPLYVLISRLWLRLRPVRGVVLAAVARLRRD